MVMHPPAYAVAYQTEHSSRRLLTPAFQSADAALMYLYTEVASWHMAVVKTVTHTDQTRTSI